MEREEAETRKAFEEEQAAQSKAKASSSRGSLPKGFEPKPEPEQPKKSRGTLPKGF